MDSSIHCMDSPVLRVAFSSRLNKTRGFTGVSTGEPPDGCAFQNIKAIQPQMCTDSTGGSFQVVFQQMSIEECQNDDASQSEMYTG